MNISYKWLKEYVDFDLTAQQVADALTSTGLEVDALEEVQSIKGGLKGLYVGKVLTCEAHPNSDHLHVTTVDLGRGEPSQIVCGAPNVAAGQKVIVADLGCVLYDGVTTIPVSLYYQRMPSLVRLLLNTIIWRATGSSRWISPPTVLTVSLTGAWPATSMPG